ncbi:hypothetical protein [Actinomadura formosensis]|uniref:hypothetical protein n=1 Tax=Actinomadura formosensis TaxID=60706 RepID=UPI001041493D|nr:hypothetical protein [Actinomadura formosensis]
MTDTSRVVFSRPKRALRDLLRSYRLFVYGAPYGKIKPGGEVSVDIAPGTHEVQARIDWSGSPRLAFTAAPGEVVHIRVEPAGNAFQMWQSWTATGYIKLTLVPSMG